MGKKPKWGKPKLVILIRSKPEEMVLHGCKHYPIQMYSMEMSAYSCFERQTCNIPCASVTLS